MNAVIHPFPPRRLPERSQVSLAKPVVIGFAGPIDCGKSTAARVLEVKHQFARTRFAAPLKQMMRVLLFQAGHDDETIERMIEGDLKELSCVALGGQSPRHAMQTLGTEWGRGLIDPDLWATVWRSGVEALIAGGLRRIVVKDLRFANEAEAVRELGGVVIYIENPAAEEARLARNHESERFAFKPDRILPNAGTIEEFQAAVEVMAGLFLRET